MKRMHEDKFINELNATASEALENANNAQSDIDNLSSVYTFAKLEISESDMDDINPYGTPEPVSLSVGDRIYENGEAVELTAAKLEELYASNLIILSSGVDPTKYDTIMMQKQSADPLDDGSDGSARFESFTVARGVFYHWTMNVNRVDSGSGEGAGIAISCTAIRPQAIYYHAIAFANYTGTGAKGRGGFVVMNNSPTPFTPQTIMDYIDAQYAALGDVVRIMCSGGITISNEFITIAFIGRSGDAENRYIIGGASPNSGGSFYRFTAQEMITLLTPTFTDGVFQLLG